MNRSLKKVWNIISTVLVALVVALAYPLPWPASHRYPNLFLYAGLCAVSLGMIAVLCLKRKEAKK